MTDAPDSDSSATTAHDAADPAHPADPADAMPRRRRRHPLARSISVATGSVFLVIGIITAPTPIPIGVVLIAIGLYLLARDSEIARHGIRRLRRRFPTLDRGLCSVAPRLPRAVRAVIRRTAPLSSRRKLAKTDRGDNDNGQTPDHRKAA